MRREWFVMRVHAGDALSETLLEEVPTKETKLVEARVAKREAKSKEIREQLASGVVSAVYAMRLTDCREEENGARRLLPCCAPSMGMSLRMWWPTQRPWRSSSSASLACEVGFFRGVGCAR